MIHCILYAPTCFAINVLYFHSIDTNIKEEANDTNSLSLRGDRKIPIRLGQKLYQAAVSGGNKNVQFFEFDDSFEHR